MHFFLPDALCSGVYKSTRFAGKWVVHCFCLSTSVVLFVSKLHPRVVVAKMATAPSKVSDSTGTNPKEAKKDRMKWAVRLLSWVPTLACLSLCALLAFRLVNLESKVEVIQWQLQKLQNIPKQAYNMHQESYPRQKRSVQTDKTNDEEECSCTGLPGKTVIHLPEKGPNKVTIIHFRFTRTSWTTRH